MKPGKICVVGLGYIGLPTAAVFATGGWDVLGVDVNRQTVDTINAGQIHIVEPDLDEAVRDVVDRGALRAATLAEPADAFLIAVPTPFKDDHAPDLGFVEAAARSLAPSLRPGNVVVLESTSPVGATEQMLAWLAEERPDLRFPAPGDHTLAPDVFVAHCPERVLPGNVLNELVRNDRIIGGITRECAERAVAIYRTVVAGECILTDARAAELCKLAENSFRDVNIAYANELSLVCDRLGIDVWNVIALANRHPRVNILQPGPGVGGHCIAVDPWFIVDSAPEQARLIRTAREVNDSKPGWVVAKVKQAVVQVVASRPGATAGDIAVACLGLAFKPDIDDLRESPALAIACELGRILEGPVLSSEPNISAVPASSADAIRLVSIDEALAAADVVVLLVDHTPFRAISRASLAGKQIVDTRGLWR